MTAVLQHIIFTGASFSAILILAFFALPRRSANLYYMLILLIALMVTQIFAWFNISRIFFRPTWINYLLIGFNYLIGPSVYYFFFSTLQGNFSNRKYANAAFIPGIAVEILIPLTGIFWPSLMPADPQHYFHGQSLTLPDILLGAAFAQNNIYYYLVYRAGSTVFNFRLLRSERAARLFLSLFIIIGLINVYGILAFIIRDIIHMYIGSSMVTCIITLFFMFSYRYPEFFIELETVIEVSRDNEGEKKKSTLQNMNLKELHLQLVELMNTEKLYMEENLTLARVAEELEIRPYQLSEFMNQHLKINFSQFINRFRIEKAKQLLVAEENSNILSIAFKVGFNSKANFNLTFSSIVGKSPRQYLRDKKKT